MQYSAIHTGRSLATRYHSLAKLDNLDSLANLPQFRQLFNSSRNAALEVL